MARHPNQETSVVVRGGQAVTFVCGIEVQPDQTDPVSLGGEGGSDE